MSDDDGSGWELLYPFVGVRSVGGPFEDESFAAGWECGKIAERMDAGAAIAPQPVRYANVAQLDLIAMAYGYMVTVEPWDDEPPTWTQATFEKRSDDDLPPRSAGA